MKIGFFGGSFDPIHFGHLNLAIELKERAGLDEVWFCPANISPDKGRKPLASSLRLQMVNLAIKDIPGCKSIDCEIKRPGPSYTVQTLRELKEKFPEHEWFILLGNDSVMNFCNWREPNEILRIATPLVGSRISEKKQDLPEIFASGWNQIPNLEISSTEIRKRLASGLYCGHLMPAKVLDFITKNGLYSDRYEKS